MLILHTSNILKHRIEPGSDFCAIYEHMLEHWTSSNDSLTKSTTTNQTHIDLQNLDLAKSIDSPETILLPDIGAKNLQSDCVTQNVTIKLFFPADCNVARSKQIVESALSLINDKILAETLKGRSKKVVGLLLLCLDGMSFRKPLDEAHLKIMIEKWLVATKAAQEACKDSNIELNSIGVCEFAHDNLLALMDSIKQYNDTHEEDDHILIPTVDSINMPDCGRLPPELLQICEERGIKLTPHSDPMNIVDDSKLQSLSKALDHKNPPLGWNWIAKITSINKDRQILERSEFLMSAKHG